MAESNTDHNKKDDTDALRAEDIVPPYNTQRHPEQPLKQTDSSLNTNQIHQQETGATESSDVVKKVNEIPKFDLAEQIMAEQRKITSIRRKAPGRKPKAPEGQPQIQPIASASKQQVCALPEKDMIISEIVARDIEKLYRDNSSSIKNW